LLYAPIVGGGFRRGFALCAARPNPLLTWQATTIWLWRLGLVELSVTVSEAEGSTSLSGLRRVWSGEFYGWRRAAGLVCWFVELAVIRAATLTSNFIQGFVLAVSAVERLLLRRNDAESDKKNLMER
jgi:hypothetical protein